jgi:hypothetical protein
VTDCTALVFAFKKEMTEFTSLHFCQTEMWRMEGVVKNRKPGFSCSI